MSLVRCNVCRVAAASPFLNDEDWVRACPCGWTHQRCIKAVIQYVEAIHPGKNIICPFCTIPYRIVPPTPPFATFLYNISRRFNHVNKAVTTIWVLVEINGFLVMCGLINLIFIWGIKEVKRAIARDPLFISDTCFCISGTAICITSIPWEDTILRILRRGCHLPVIGNILPMEYPNVVVVSHHRYRIVDGILLPFFGILTGNLLFSNQESKFKRFLMGGVTFLAVKGFLTMYYRQKKYSRFCCMDIENYES